MKAPQLTEHPQVRGKNVQRKIRTRLDLLSIPQSVGENVKTFRWDRRLFKEKSELYQVPSLPYYSRQRNEFPCLQANPK